MDEASAGHDHPPDEHESSQVGRRSLESVQDNIARHLYRQRLATLVIWRYFGRDLPARMNGTKKIARAMLYCSPVIPRLGRRPSILAFPGIVIRKLAVSDADGHTNIGFIDVCNQIQKHQHWDQAPLIQGYSPQNGWDTG